MGFLSDTLFRLNYMKQYLRIYANKIYFMLPVYK